MTNKDFEAFLQDVLDRRFARNAAAFHALLFDLWVKYQDDNKKVIEEVQGRIASKLAADFHATFEEGQFVENTIDKEMLALFCAFPRFTFREFRIGSKHVGADRLDKDPGTRVFHDFGVVSPCPDGIMLGYPLTRRGIGSDPDETVVPPWSYDMAVSKLAYAFHEPGIRASFLQHVAQHRQRPSPAAGSDGQAVARGLEDASASLDYLWNWIRESVKQSIIKVAEQRDTPSFYNDIQTFYGEGAIHVYSTTSGLVVIEEYTGGDEQKKSLQRKAYFDALGGSRIPIYYELDPRSTARGTLKKSKRSDEDNATHFARFLMRPNIEVSEGDFDSPREAWKKRYTLVSSSCGVAYSQRNPELKKDDKISNGMTAGKQIFLQLGQEAYNVADKFYRAETESGKTVFKRMGDALAEDEAFALALGKIREWRKSYLT